MGVGMGTWTLAHTCDQQLCLLSLMLLGGTQQAGGRCGVGWRARVGARVGPTLCVPHPVLLPGVFFFLMLALSPGFIKPPLCVSLDALRCLCQGQCDYSSMGVMQHNGV